MNRQSHKSLKKVKIRIDNFSASSPSALVFRPEDFTVRLSRLAPALGPFITVSRDGGGGGSVRVNVAAGADEMHSAVFSKVGSLFRLTGGVQSHSLFLYRHVQKGEG